MWQEVWRDGLVVAALLFYLSALYFMCRTMNTLSGAQRVLRRARMTTKQEVVIRELDEIANSLCPVCAGNFHAISVSLNDRDTQIRTSGEAIEGWHDVQTTDGHNDRLPCIAYPIRRLSQRLFDDMMQHESHHEVV